MKIKVVKTAIRLLRWLHEYPDILPCRVGELKDSLGGSGVDLNVLPRAVLWLYQKGQLRLLKGHRWDFIRRHERTAI
jgi:hypothetical protein